MTRRSRGTVKCSNDDDVAREQQALPNKARRKERNAAFAASITTRSFRGNRLKPTATSHGSTPGRRDPETGRLHSTQPLMHETTHEQRTEPRRLSNRTPVSTGLSARRYLWVPLYNVHYFVQCTLVDAYTLVLSEEVAA